MSFGFSVGDCVLLASLARAQYKNCVAAGSEYKEAAYQIKTLYGVLKLLRDGLTKDSSLLAHGDQEFSSKLALAIEGCKHILEDLQILLAKYEGLCTDSEATGTTRKLWHKMRFGTKIQALGEVRSKIIFYTTTISVSLDAMQLQATGRLENTANRMENKLDTGLTLMMSNFQDLKIAVVGEIQKARAATWHSSTLSLMTLSTYNGDNKEVWHEFRRELIDKGFKSRHLERHKDMLQSYMLKLEQSGVLEEVSVAAPPCWLLENRFVDTSATLSGLQPTTKEDSPITKPDSPITKEESLATPFKLSPEQLEILGTRFKTHDSDIRTGLLGVEFETPPNDPQQAMELLSAASRLVFRQNKPKIKAQSLRYHLEWESYVRFMLSDSEAEKVIAWCRRANIDLLYFFLAITNAYVDRGSVVQRAEMFLEKMALVKIGAKLSSPLQDIDRLTVLITVNYLALEEEYRTNCMCWICCGARAKVQEAEAANRPYLLPNSAEWEATIQENMETFKIQQLLKRGFENSFDSSSDDDSGYGNSSSSDDDN